MEALREAQLYEGLALSAPPKGNHHPFLASVVFWYTPSRRAVAPAEAYSNIS